MILCEHKWELCCSEQIEELYWCRICGALVQNSGSYAIVYDEETRSYILDEKHMDWIKYPQVAEPKKDGE